MYCDDLQYISFTGHRLKLADKAENNTQVMISKVKNWLSENHHWLIIFDNADEQDVLKFLSSDEGFIEQGHRQQGDIIITTRSDVHLQNIDMEAENAIEVTELPAGDRVKFLLDRTKTSEVKPDRHDLNALHELVDSAGGIPLKLEQIGAYLVETKDSFRGYLEKVQQKGSWPLSDVCHGDRNKTVTNTYELNFQKVESANPSAMSVLYYAALMNHAKIPFSFFRSAKTCLDLNDGCCEDMNSLLKTARSYSLIRFSPKGNGFSVHAIIQEQLLKRTDAEKKEEFAFRLLDSMNAVYQDDQIDSKLRRDMLTHAHALMKKCWNKLDDDGLLVLERSPKLSIRVGLTLLKVAQTYTSTGNFDTSRNLIHAVKDEVRPELADNGALASYLNAEINCQFALLNMLVGNPSHHHQSSDKEAEQQMTQACSWIEEAKEYLQVRNSVITFLQANLLKANGFSITTIEENNF